MQPKPPPSPMEGHAIRQSQDRRRFRRIGLRMEGRIVFAGVDSECLVHEMSSTGAIVECLPLPAEGAQVALDIPGVVLTRGLVIRHMDEKLACIELDTLPARRLDLSDRLIVAAHRFPADEAQED